MRHPDSILPLLVTLGVAVVLHAVLLPVGAAILDRPSSSSTEAEIQIAIISSPEALAADQTQADVTLSITNTGNAAAANVSWSLYWSDRPRLAEHQLSMTGQFPLASSPSLEPGQMLAREVSLPRDENHEGPRFIVGVVRAENAAAAFASTSIWIDSSQPAEVEIFSVETPEAGVAGGTLPVGYTLRNHPLAGWAKAGWTDRVILSPDGEVSAEDLVLLNLPRRRPLGPGESAVSGPYEVRIPLGVAPGEYQLIVDSSAPQAERVTVPLRVESATHPDLAPRNVGLSSAGAGVTVNEPVAVLFDVVNRSPLATPDLLWGDRVYWSIDDEVSPDDALLVSEPRGAYPGELPGGGRYRSGPHEIVITPELALSPVMYLIVVADDEDDIDEGDYEGNNALAVEVVVQQPVEAEQPEELKLGRDDEPARVTVAWIAHDDFQELLARESVTLQPILQDKVDPTPNAPLERDPEDVGQSSPSAPPPSPPSPNPADTPTPPAQQLADTARDPIETAGPGDLSVAEPGAVDQLGNAPRDTPGVPLPDPTPPQSPPEIRTPPTVVAQEEGDKPTSAPRDDRESDPTTLINARSVSPGQVLVGPGLEVKTFRPNWSAAARFNIPRNPRVTITFDPDGSVLQADLITSTGFDNIDGPLLSSLYRWQAKGQRLEQFDAPFQIEITVLLNGEEPPENDREKEK
ncbi:MAG: hypothetical protein AAGH99_05005 [Planctomycetota bacterium]